MNIRRSTMDELREAGEKQHSPAAARNREAIGQVLAKELPAEGTVLEVASGTGQHAAYFADLFPQLVWQPSDPEPEAVQSIAAYRSESGRENLKSPIRLDASFPDTWPAAQFDAMLCINMIHVSPWAASEGLFAGAARLLGSQSPLILYGPYLEEDVETAASNLAFDENLKARNPLWGLRHLSAVGDLAVRNGFTRTGRYAMPANNLTVVFRRN